MTKLTAELALAIFRSPLSNVEAGVQFGLSRSTVNNVRVGRAWSHVTGIRAQDRPAPTPRPKKPKAPCVADGCEKAAKSKGYCDAHYWRSLRNCGTPITDRKPRKKGVGLLFVEAALATATDDCIVWPYSTSDGYGALSAQGRKCGAHLWVCEQAHGPKPFSSAHAAHRCGNRTCVNKRHIRWASPLENILDKEIHGRQTKGEGVNTAVLRADQVIAIASDSRPFVTIAQEYGCAPSTVRSVQAGETWADVTGIRRTAAKARLPRLNFTRETVSEIRAHVSSCSEAAKRFGCSRTTINEIRRGLRTYA